MRVVQREFCMPPDDGQALHRRTSPGLLCGLDIHSASPRAFARVHNRCAARSEARAAAPRLGWRDRIGIIKPSLAIVDYRLVDAEIATRFRRPLSAKDLDLLLTCLTGEAAESGADDARQSQVPPPLHGRPGRPRQDNRYRAPPRRRVGRVSVRDLAAPWPDSCFCSSGAWLCGRRRHSTVLPGRGMAPEGRTPFSLIPVPLRRAEGREDPLLHHTPAPPPPASQLPKNLSHSARSFMRHGMPQSHALAKESGRQVGADGRQNQCRMLQAGWLLQGELKVGGADGGGGIRSYGTARQT